MVRKGHTVLHVALQQAVSLGMLTTNPATRTRPPRPGHTETRVLTRDEVRALLTALEGGPLYAPVAVTVTTGLCRGELLGLRWAETDLEAGRLSVVRALSESSQGVAARAPKTATSRRVVPLYDFTIGVLKAHRARQHVLRLGLSNRWRDHGLVFPETSDRDKLRPGRQWAPRAFEHAWRRALHAQGVKELAEQLAAEEDIAYEEAVERFQEDGAKHPLYDAVRFHDLRHTHITDLLHSGVNVRDIAARVGHASPAMTLNRYAHLLPDSQEAAVRALDGLVE